MTQLSTAGFLPPRSQFWGISWHAHTLRWRARPTIAGKRYYLGAYDSELQAATAADNLRVSLVEGAMPNPMITEARSRFVLAWDAPPLGLDTSYVAALQRDPCSYCGGAGGTRDHIEATNRGGADDPSNWTAACRSCNTSKYTSPLLFFLLRRQIDRVLADLSARRTILLSGDERTPA